MTVGIVNFVKNKSQSFSPSKSELYYILSEMRKEEHSYCILY